jgi:hypothetical protein
LKKTNNLKIRLGKGSQMTTFKLQNNYERKQHLNNDISMTIQGSSSNQIINNDSLIENLRVLVKEYLEIVIFKNLLEKFEKRNDK